MRVVWLSVNDPSPPMNQLKAFCFLRRFDTDRSVVCCRLHRVCLLHDPAKVGRSRVEAAECLCDVLHARQIHNFDVGLERLVEFCVRLRAECACGHSTLLVESYEFV